MILFIILAIIILMALIIGVTVLMVSGAAFITVFGDLIICIILICLIIKIFTRNR